MVCSEKEINVFILKNCFLHNSQSLEQYITLSAERRIALSTYQSKLNTLFRFNVRKKVYESVDITDPT